MIECKSMVIKKFYFDCRDKFYSIFVYPRFIRISLWASEFQIFQSDHHLDVWRFWPRFWWNYSFLQLRWSRSLGIENNQCIKQLLEALEFQKNDASIGSDFSTNPCFAFSTFDCDFDGRILRNTCVNSWAGETA